MKATDLISILQAAVAEHGDSILVGLDTQSYGASPVKSAEVRKHKGYECESWEERDDFALAPRFLVIN